MSHLKIVLVFVTLILTLAVGSRFYSNWNTNLISAVELHNQLDDPDLIVIDIRNDEFFNGWPVKEGIKPGHIPEAINIQLSLLDLAGDNSQQIAYLADKGVTPDKKIVVYCNTAVKSKALYQRLKQLGFNNIYDLEGGLKSWGDEGFDVTVLENYSKLVYPQWLSQLIQGESPLTMQNNKYVLLEVGQGNCINPKR